MSRQLCNIHKSLKLIMMHMFNNNEFTPVSDTKKAQLIGITFEFIV